MDKIDQILSRGVTNIIPGKEALEKVLRSGAKLNIYYGIDPTTTKIHIGYAVHLRKMQQLVEEGHNVALLVGDYTALVGDTSDKESERPILSYEEIQANLKTYKQQAAKVLDFAKIKLVFNGDWLSKLEFKTVLQLCQHFSLNDFVSRELIRKRLAKGDRVRLDEVFYPLMQGYDSFFLDTDLQMGAADQIFNMQAGRTLIKDFKGKESFILINDYLMGTDGRKMSKTWSNAIWVEDEPNEMFGKVMSLLDDLIIQYFTLATNLPMNEVSAKETRLKKGENPMVLKKELALQIVSELHSPEAAKKAQTEFEKTFQKGELDTANLPIVNISSLPSNPIDPVTMILYSIKVSRSEAKRLLDQKALEINGKIVTGQSPLVEIKAGDIARIGKKKFVKFID